MDLSLAGKKVLVTGGTRGIGRAVVQAFAREGANVGFCARTAYDVEMTEEQVAANAEGRIAGSTVDVTHQGELARWVSDCAVLFDGIDIVVSCAAVMVLDDTDETWGLTLQVDLMGTVRLVKAALPYLVESRTASIVAVSGVAGREADFAAGPYGTAKTAVVGYIAGQAHRLAARGIRANTVSAGHTYFPGSVFAIMEQEDPDSFASALGANPTGRMGTPAEVADVVVFVASPRASRVTGANILVDGGLSRGIQL